MASIEPYSLRDAQQLVDNALRASRDRHSEWRLLEQLYASGTTDGLASNTSANGITAQIIQDVTGVPLDVVNLVLPHINIILATVVSRDPRFVCEPLSGGDESEDYAVVAEAVLKYFWNRTKATVDLFDATKDAVVVGNGFLKVGWNYTEKRIDRDRDDVDAELESLIAADAEMAADQGVEPTPRRDLEKLVSLVTVDVEADEPYVEYVSPFDIFVPHDARRLWESRWVAQRLIKPADEVRAQLGLADDVALTTTDASARDSAQRDRGGEVRDPFAYVEVFEFYDMRTRRMMVFQRGGDQILFEGALPYAHRYPPFVHIANYRRNPSEFWAFGDLKNIAGLQSMLNETFAEQMENMRRAGNKVLIAEALCTPEVEEGLASAETNLAIKVKLPDGRPMQEMVMPLPSQPLPADVYNAANSLQAGMAQVLGLSDFQRGMSGADRMSGTAAAAVEGSTTLRAMDKVAAVESAAAEVGTLMLLLCQEFMGQDTAIRVVGSRAVVWAPVSPEIIRGEYRVAVEGGSIKAVNPMTRQQRAMDRASTLVPLLVNNGYDPEPLLRSIVRDLGEDPDLVLKKLEAEPAPAGPAPTMGEPMIGEPEMTPYLGPQSDLGGDAIMNQLQGDVAL
jgi:hypothetical protein